MIEAVTAVLAILAWTVVIWYERRGKAAKEQRRVIAVIREQDMDQSAKIALVTELYGKRGLDEFHTPTPQSIDPLTGHIA